MFLVIDEKYETLFIHLGSWNLCSSKYWIILSPVFWCTWIQFFSDVYFNQQISALHAGGVKSISSIASCNWKQMVSTFITLPSEIAELWKWQILECLQIKMLKYDTFCTQNTKYVIIRFKLEPNCQMQFRHSPY